MSITNTSKDIGTAPTGLSAMLGGPKFIEAQEAQGQRELVKSSLLPADITDRESFERLGFTFGEPVPGDSLFVNAALPPGWTRQGSDHAMWSYLLDDKGRRRVSVFYKAAFYDRDARMRLDQRYGVGRDYDAPENVSVVRVKDHDGTVIWESERITTPEGQRRWDIDDGLRAQAHEWLDANRPAWRDVVAAWDE